MNTNICKEIQRQIGEQFTCTELGDYLRIRTPYLYPDGDNIDLFCKSKGDTITVTDLGETTGWLRMQSLSLRRSPKQNRLIADVLTTHGVELYRGMLLARCRPDEQLAAVVSRVAQASLRVSDLWFTLRIRAVESITDEVADYLTECDLPFVRSEKLSGRSGRGWTVDFHIRTHERSSLVYVLSTANRSAANRVTEQIVAAWYDLHHFAAGPEALHFVSLFDDTSDVWTSDNFRLMEQLSTVSYWSRPDEFKNVLVQQSAA